MWIYLYLILGGSLTFAFTDITSPEIVSINIPKKIYFEQLNEIKIVFTENAAHIDPKSLRLDFTSKEGLINNFIIDSTVCVVDNACIISFRSIKNSPPVDFIISQIQVADTYGNLSIYTSNPITNNFYILNKQKTNLRIAESELRSPNYPDDISAPILRSLTFPEKIRTNSEFRFVIKFSDDSGLNLLSDGKLNFPIGISNQSSYSKESIKVTNATFASADTIVLTGSLYMTTRPGTYCLSSFELIDMAMNKVFYWGALFTLPGYEFYKAVFQGNRDTYFTKVPVACFVVE